MASLLANLPQPTKQHAAPIAAVPTSSALVTAGGKEPPPYLRRKGFIPRKPEDFNNGGAFPEIHLAQYPLDMGRDASGGGGGKQLAVSLNADGQLNYDAIVKQGSNRDRIVHSDHLALVPKIDRMSAEALARPTDEDIEKTTKETAAHLERLVTGKLSSVNPATLPDQPGTATLIKYTPSTQGPQHASGAGQRIIKMQDMPVDPLEPPKFRHVKVPRGPGSPPVPVLHSPPRDLTVKDQQDWKIPPCISNWKNPKGYTIPLDKRLAADGRGLQQSQINDKFASLSEALFTAEAKAREAIQMRSAIQKELMAKEKGRKEAELRQLAMAARMERGVGGAAGAAGLAARAGGDGGPPEHLPPPPPGRPHASAMDFDGPGREDLPPPPPGRPGGGYGGRDERDERGRGRGRDGDELMDRDVDDRPRGRDGGDGDGGDANESREEREERRRRDEIREERRRERERERRLEAAGTLSKKSKLTRDRERDVSEKVALGMANVGGGEVAYDQRLFNQDAGLGSGFGGDDSYSAYDKPMWAERQGNQYKPTKAAGGEDDEPGGDVGGDAGERGRTFRPDKGFAGADAATAGAAGGRGGGRLEFERQPEEADPFGLDQFLSEVKGGGSRKKGLDAIGGGGGSMKAAAGGASFDEAGGLGRKMQFTSGSQR